MATRRQTSAGGFPVLEERAFSQDRPWFCGHFRTSRSGGAHFHEFIEVLRFRSGHPLILLWEGKQYDIPPGSLVCIPGFGLHDFGISRETDFTLLGIHAGRLTDCLAAKAHRQELAAALGRLCAAAPIIAEPADSLLALFDSLPGADNLAGLGMLVRELAALPGEAAPLPLDQPDFPWATIAALIEERCGGRLQLQQLASELGYSSASLSRGFRRYCGSHFSEYLQKARIHRAMALIATGALKLGQIAQECGFADAAHFSRVFRKVTGIGPLEYRKAFCG